MTYYHVTLKENLDSILKNGLIPKIGPLSKMADEPIERIYLFPSSYDMDMALMQWFGEVINETYGESVECCSLKIDLPKNFPITFGTVPYECYSYVPIPPEYIEYFMDE